MNEFRGQSFRNTKAEISNTRLMMKPLVLMMASVRETMVPAISVAFGRLKALKTLKALGATAPLKKIAAPSHNPSSNSLTLLSMGTAMLLVVLVDFGQQANPGHLKSRRS